MSGGVEIDPWTHLRRLTPARVALGRAGPGIPTHAHLALSLAHARARDAVHTGLDVEALARSCAAADLDVTHAQSRASDGATYLRRPDLGRRLDPACAAPLEAAFEDPRTPDLLCVVGDGLSAAAAQRHAAPLLGHLVPRLGARGFRVPSKIVVALRARVALGDEIGALVGARTVLVLIGERPGLTAPDSLGAYLTFGPKVGRTDAERNCVSNIRPEGLPVEAAADRLAWLIEAALRRKLTGIGLKDRSEGELPG